MISELKEEIQKLVSYLREYEKITKRAQREFK
jgi:hypothetical protein